MKFRYMALALMVACAGTAGAQERSAGNALDAQMTWQGLATRVDGVNEHIGKTASRIDLIEACGVDGMIYAPGAPGANGAGCVAPALPVSVLNSINTAKNTVNTVVSNSNVLVNCGSQGMIYDKSSNTCTTVVRMDMVAQTLKSASSMKGGGKHASYALSTCPANTVLIGCSGARNAQITDTCDESDCGLVGYGPINATTCRVTVDTDKGTNPTVWTTCLKNK